MPNFKKTESELTTRLDQWLYFIKHLEDFESIPLLFKDEVFEQAFEKAKLANFGKSEWNSYHASLKTFRDNKNTFDYAKQTAYSEGKMEGLLEVARNLFGTGLSIDLIIKATGLSESEIKALIT